MRNLAVIPARGGSKRISKKNIKEFNGQPIISFPINCLKESKLFDEIMVSTDDLEIAEIAKKYEAKIPFFRSSTNSDDFSTLTDVLLEVIESYRQKGVEYDNICCILPTAALITKDKIMNAYNLMIDNNYGTVVPVIKYSYPIQRALKDDGGFLKMKDLSHINTRSQDLEDSYHDSGQFYWINTEKFLADKKIFTDNTGFVELKEFEAQDVDTEEDWIMLELKHQYKRN